MSLSKHESFGKKKMLSVLFCGTFLLCTLCYTFTGDERIGIYTNLFSWTDSSCLKICSKSVVRLEAELSSLSAGSEPWALTSRRVFTHSDPFCSPVLTDSCSFSSGSVQGLLASLLLSSWILKRQVKAEFLIHYIYFFPSTYFNSLHKQIEENKF